MRKNRFFFIMALIAILSLTGCGGGDWEDDSPPFNTAKEAEKAFQTADDVFHEGSGEAPGLEWSRDESVPEDRLVVRFGHRVIYNGRHWFVYGNRGEMRDGADVVLVHEYDSSFDSGRAVLFVDGRRVTLPDFRVDCGGTKCAATLRNVREIDGGFLLGFASYEPLESEEVPVSYAWMLYHPRTGFMLNLGEYCSACTRR